MFVAKFSQVASEKFTEDKNGNMPYIGTVLAGKATGTIINGTIFERDGLQLNKMYACQNVTVELERDGVATTVVNVQVVAEVGLLEFLEVEKKLGKAIVEIAEATPVATTTTTKAAPQKVGQPAK